MAATYNLAIEQGADYQRQLTWFDDAGLPVNLTGWTAKMQLRTKASSETVLLELTHTGGITLGGTNGTILIQINNTTTASFGFVSAVYDLELTSGSGQVTRLLQGSVSVSREVTR